MNLVTHFIAQGSVYDLMSLYRTLPGKFRADYLCLKMMSIAVDGHLCVRHTTLNHLFDVFRMHHACYYPAPTVYFKGAYP
jgi:hypothetical protein